MSCEVQEDGFAVAALVHPAEDGVRHALFPREESGHVVVEFSGSRVRTDLRVHAEESQRVGDECTGVCAECIAELLGRDFSTCWRRFPLLGWYLNTVHDLPCQYLLYRGTGVENLSHRLPGGTVILIANSHTELKGTLKTVVLGIVVIGLIAILTTELLIAFGVNNTFLLILFGTVVPIVIGAIILLRILDVL